MIGVSENTKDTAKAGDQNQSEQKTDEQQEQQKQFVPPSSQEELDQIINKAVGRTHKKYEDYDELKQKAEKFDEVEEANKSELEREKEAREEAERKLQEMESTRKADEARKQLAEEYGVPEDALRGSDRDELEEHAKLLHPHFKKPNGPSSDGQGKVGAPIDSGEQITSKNQLENMSPDEIEKARKDGRLDHLMGVQK